MFAALFATALMFCRAAAAHTEVQKFINPCGGQQLCPSFQLVMTPPDGWVLDAQATKENNVQIMVPKGKTFATAQPLMYVRVFYHKDKQQTLDDFARVSNERWLAASAKAKIAALAAVARTKASLASCVSLTKIRARRSRLTRWVRSASIATRTATNSCSTW